MNTLATVTGYLVWLAVSVLVIGGVIAWIVDGIIQARALASNKAIDEYSKRIGNRLHGDADWFSEDMPTCKLLKEVADNIRHGVSMGPGSTRERWRGWMANRKTGE